MDTHKKLRVHLSALVDGELPVAEQELALAALQSADGRATWATYHRIGDVLRGAATPELSDGFSAALNERLARDASAGRRAPRARSTKDTGPVPEQQPPLAAPAGLPDSGPSAGADAKAVLDPKPAIASVS